MRVCWRLVKLHWMILVAVALGLLRSVSVHRGEYFELLLPVIILVSILVVKEYQINNYNKLLVTMPIVRSEIHSYILVMQGIVVMAYCVASEVGLLMQGELIFAMVEWFCLGILCIVIAGVELAVRLFHSFYWISDNDVMVVKNMLLYALAVLAGSAVPYLVVTGIDTVYSGYNYSVDVLIWGCVLVGSALFLVSWLFIRCSVSLKIKQDE